MILRCTTRVLDLIGVRAQALSDVPPSDEDWYANLFLIAMRGGLEHADIDALNHEQRRTLRNRNGYHQPIELVLQRMLDA